MTAPTTSSPRTRSTAISPSCRCSPRRTACASRGPPERLYPGRVPRPAVEVDVAVVGAGPAGSAAAITLAQAGANVALVDKATFPRDKCCGDGLTTGALRLLEQLGVSPLSLPSWQSVDAAWVRSPSGRVVELPLPSGRGIYAAVARRTELDALLVDRARDAGAEVHEGSTLTGVRSTADAIELDVDEVGTISARMAIGADGMWSPLRKMLGAAEAGYLGEWHAFRQYFAEVGPAAASQLWVWFEPDLLPGYAWSFPLAGGRANVGFGIPRGGAISTQAMKQLWPDLLARPHIHAVLGGSAVAEAPHKAWPIPARIGSLPLTAAAGAVRRRRGRRDRPPDGRGHRPGAAHRRARSRRDPRPRTRPPGADRRGLPRRGDAQPRRGSPHVGRARQGPPVAEWRAGCDPGRGDDRVDQEELRTMAFRRRAERHRAHSPSLAPPFPRPRRRLRRGRRPTRAIHCDDTSRKLPLRTLSAIEPRRSRGVRSQVEARHLSRPPGEVTGLAA